MIGRVNRIRAVPGKRMPPRTSGKAAIVPMIVARIATTTATRTELNRAEWIALSVSIRSYQCSRQPGDREARRLGLLEREEDEEHDRQVEEDQRRAGHDGQAAPRLPGERADRHRLERR